MLYRHFVCRWVACCLGLALGGAGSAAAALPTVTEIPKPDVGGKPEVFPRPQATVPEGFKELPFVDPRPLPAFTAAERARGFLLFQRPITRPVHPHTHPASWERIEHVSGFATPGEFEPLTFSLLPLRELKNLRVRVSELKSDTGAVIGREHLRLYLVTCWNIRYPRYTSENTYRRLPELLEPVTVNPAPRGVCQRYWVRLHVPENARPGWYRGAFTIFDDRGERAVRLPILFRVLDFRLKKDPRKRYSVYFSHVSYQYRNFPPEQVEPGLKTEFREMRNYGLDMFPTAVIGAREAKDGRDEVYFQDEHAVELMKAAGFRGPIPLSGGVWYFYGKYVPGGKIGSHWRVTQFPSDDRIYQAIETAFREFRRKYEQKGWPEMICCPLDEVAPESAEFAAKVYAAIRRAGLKTYITKDPTASDAGIYRRANAVDAWCSQPFSWPYDKVVADAAHDYWCYPNHNAGEVKDRVTMQKGGRMTYGYGLWRSGYTTLIPWHWRWVPNRDDHFDYLRGRSVSGCGNRITKDGVFIPAVYWECFREGEDDLKYLYTLEQAIVNREKAADPRCRAAVAGARRFLQSVWDSIEVQKKYLNTHLWPDDRFAGVRWRLAMLIRQLRQHPARSAAPAPSVIIEPRAPRVAQTDLVAEGLAKGYLDRLDLGANHFARWRAVAKETAMERLTEDGHSVLRFRVRVDYAHDGEGSGKYPVGWPRLALTFDPGEVNLAAYDYLYFRVKTDSNRDEVSDDTTPFIINMSARAKERVSRDLHLDLGDKPRVWLPVKISLRDFISGSGRAPDAWRDLRRLQLVVAERDYPDHTRLTFDFADLAFLRFNRPLIGEVEVNDLVLTPARPLVVRVLTYGVRADASPPGQLALRLVGAEGRIKAKRILPLAETVETALDVSSLPPGNYELQVRAMVGEKVVSQQRRPLHFLPGLLYLK
jgi:hypothetical protein